MKELNAKAKKKNITILTIIGVIIIGVLIFLLYENSYIKVKMIEQMAKKYDNYIATIVWNSYEDDKNSTFVTKVTRKGNVRKEEYKHSDGTGEVRWHTGEKVILESTKQVKNSTKITNDLDILSQYIENKDKYEYLRTEDYNGRKCMVVQFLRKNGSSDNYTKTIVWIDKERGVVLKEQHYNENEKLEYEYLYNIELNCVSQEQIQLPDLNGYEYIE